MIWVPPGYSAGETMFGLDEVRGGSCWGAGTFAGPTGARQPSQIELKHAEHQVRLMLPYKMPVAHFVVFPWLLHIRFRTA